MAFSHRSLFSSRSFRDISSVGITKLQRIMIQTITITSDEMREPTAYMPIKVESGNSNKKKRRSDYDSPHAAPVRRRYIDMNDDTDGGEDRIGVFRRKLSDDFDRIIYSSMRFSTNIESEQKHKIWDQWRIFRSLKDVLQWTLFLLWLEYCISKAHLQSMLMSRNGSLVEDFFGQLVGSVPDLTEHLHMTTAMILRHVNGMSTGLLTLNGKSRSLEWSIMGLLLPSVTPFALPNLLAHGGIPQEVQNLLLEYGIEIFAETLVEGLSRIKICTDEGRALMSLDIQNVYLRSGLNNGVHKRALFRLRPLLLTTGKAEWWKPTERSKSKLQESK
ncbi:hypothetical protein Bca4012_005819 [Brassica carinata]